ncbi:MAG: septum formation protein Maf [Marinilabiliales bacterium]|nr:MAG: septum formation protein Maf [Marinilabiliales bacterium]
MLEEKLLSYDIILASASPRRSELLKELGVRFRLLPKHIDESFDAEFPPRKVAEYLSEKKARAFSQSEIHENTIIITADTIVSIGKVILGKPANILEAKSILQQLSGNKHEVITGVTLRSIKKLKTFSVVTTVYFKELTESEMDYYIENFQPFDKAGAYGIQEWIGHAAIERIEGSYFNVMGLPTHRLYEELISFVSV